MGNTLSLAIQNYPFRKTFHKLVGYLPNMQPSTPRSRLLSLPYKIRMQIWQYAIPSDTELSFCACLHQPPRASRRETCCCYEENILAPEERAFTDYFHMDYRPLPTPKFLRGTEELISELPLTCQQIFADTQAIVQHPKHITLCSPECLPSLLSTLTANQLAMVSKSTVLVDLRPPFLSKTYGLNFVNWKCINDMQSWTERAMEESCPSSSVVGLETISTLLDQHMDFFPLEIKMGQPHDRKVMANAKLWRDARKSRTGLDELIKVISQSMSIRFENTKPVQQKSTSP